MSGNNLNKTSSQTLPTNSSLMLIGLYNLWVLLFLSAIITVACQQNPGTQTHEGHTDHSSLTMEQVEPGQWVIMDNQKTVLYDVFIYDNGPDYPIEGLIRVVKDGKIGYADASTYALVIEPQFDCAYPFENGQAKVSTSCQSVPDGEHSMWISDHWQYVDKQGHFNISPPGDR